MYVYIYIYIYIIIKKRLDINTIVHTSKASLMSGFRCHSRRSPSPWCYRAGAPIPACRQVTDAQLASDPAVGIQVGGRTSGDSVGDSIAIHNLQKISLPWTIHGKKWAQRRNNGVRPHNFTHPFTKYTKPPH